MIKSDHEISPIAYGYVSGLWTSTRIADVIAEEFGIRYHAGHVRKLLADFGFSVQSPKRILARADKEKQAKWTTKTYPTIKKKLTQKARASSSVVLISEPCLKLRIEGGEER